MPPAADSRRSKQFIENFIEKLERYEKFIEQHLATAKARQVQHRLSDIGESWSIYQRMLPPYEFMDTELLSELVRERIENLYFSIATEFEEKLDELKEARRKAVAGEEKPNQTNFTPPTMNARLPTIELPTFSGGYLDWHSFIGTFNTLIHNNPSLSNQTRFQYLKRSLDGVAASAIAAIELCDENYEVALNILKERFDKPNFIIEQHIHQLFSFKPIDRPDPKQLLGLLDHYRSHLRSLEVMKRPVKQWDDIIVYTMVSKFDPETKQKWNDAAPSTHLPTVEDLCRFISSRAHRLESQSKPMLPSSTPTKPPSSIPSKPQKHTAYRYNRSSATSLTVAKTNHHCVHCKAEGHSLVRCLKFLHLPVDQRHNFVTKFQLCYNCLRADHAVAMCPVTLRCRHCNSQHHSLLHKVADEHHTIQSKAESPLPVLKTGTSSVATINESNEFPANHLFLSSLAAAQSKAMSSSFVYLATALVTVLDNSGNHVTGRALLDSGSQLSFMTESFLRSLNLPCRKTSISIHGIGSKTVSSLSSCSITLRSNITSFCANLDVQVIPAITSYQPVDPFGSIKSWGIPPNLQLADPDFFKAQHIDLLLGAEIYYELLSVGQIKLAGHLPILQNTVLGWIISGRCSSSTNSDQFCHLVAEDLSNLSEQIEKFWNIENIPHSIMQLSSEESECERHFATFTTRDNDGRFVVKLPFSADPSTLGNSRIIAENRFYNLERRLHKSQELLQNYSKFIDEYRMLGHMETVNPDSLTAPIHYFPHHCVLKPDSSSTKLRVVFDGSAKTSNGTSINSIMMVGPVVQNDLFSILIRFRTHAYVFSADIAKMYRQVQLHENDQKLQLIVWRESPGNPLLTFKLKTVTYGTSSAPYLATRCVKQLAIDNKGTFAIAADAIENDIYVDDILTGANSIKAAIELRHQISGIMQTAGMELRKWCANHPEIIKDIPVEFKETLFKIDENDLVKTLGTFWHPTSDKFTFVVNFSEKSTVSKRAIFSEIARIYDPLGLLSPVVVLGKLFIQSLWKLQLGWDQALPQNLHTYWQTLRKSLIVINQFTIDRHLFSSTKPHSIQIHGFADASERAYGAVLYIRSSTYNGLTSVKLLCSKSRVAPLKKTTLPRLELCAAVLLAQLTHKVYEKLNFKVDKTFYWSDSTITLYWIKSCPSKWKTFVSHRVTTVQEVSQKESWLHVPTEHNPADLISRGVLPEKLIQSDLWLHGPSFLQKEALFWPTIREKFPLPEEALELKKITTANVVSSDIPSILTEIKFHNDFRKLRRIIAYILRFKLHPKFKCSGPLKLEELERALHTILRIVQKECFPVEYFGLEKVNFIIKNPVLRSLSLFLDKDHVLRVGGRLQQTTLPYTSKHPILLPNSHQFTLTLLNFYHRKLLHAGPRALLAAVRQEYWPIYGATVCKKIFRTCKECCRARPIPMTQQMGNLPPERVIAAPPFYTVGVDFAGPFFIHYRIRGKPPTKTYLCIFICFVTKAVHLELASDLSTPAFLGCFKRFVATRGLCKRVFSDNGTNFIGANSELRDLYALLSSQQLNHDIQSMCEDDQIEWKFTPPSTPNFGGLYEAGVKIAKFHLRRTIGLAKLTYEQLMTLVKQVEAVLNSRPLGPITSSIDDIDCLTPGHFLIGRPLNALPMPGLPDRPPIDTWKQIDFYHRVFWNRWSSEYLRSLQQRHRWTKPTRNLAVGELVVLLDENQPPLKWKLGRINEIFPGTDGLVRVATVKTAHGIYKRGISKICRLPQNIIETTESFQGGQNVNAS